MTLRATLKTRTTGSIWSPEDLENEIPSGKELRLEAVQRLEGTRGLEHVAEGTQVSGR